LRISIAHLAIGSEDHEDGLWCCGHGAESNEIMTDVMKMQKIMTNRCRTDRWIFHLSNGHIRKSGVVPLDRKQYLMREIKKNDRIGSGSLLCLFSSFLGAT
jgi:hypothetical protein